METNTDLSGKICIVKFFENNKGSKKLTNDLVTRTLGKVGFVDKSWKPKNNDTHPIAGEFWKVEIIREVCPGKNSGCYILKPICKIEASAIIKLVPGMYTEEEFGGLLIIKPKQGGNCIITLNQKQKKYYSWVVSL